MQHNSPVPTPVSFVPQNYKECPEQEGAGAAEAPALENPPILLTPPARMGRFEPSHTGACPGTSSSLNPAAWLGPCSALCSLSPFFTLKVISCLSDHAFCTFHPLVGSLTFSEFQQSWACTFQGPGLFVTPKEPLPWSLGELRGPQRQ